jgi:hypothetical protein
MNAYIQCHFHILVSLLLIFLNYIRCSCMKYLLFIYVSIHVIYFCSCLCTTISLHIVLLSLQFFRGMENRLLWKKRLSQEEDVHCSKLWKEGSLHLLSTNNISRKRYVCIVNKCMVNFFCHRSPKFQCMGWDLRLKCQVIFHMPLEWYWQIFC